MRVVVATDSVDTHHEARDQHLNSGDFLDSERIPQMTFTAESARRTGEHTFAVAGELTLLGTTRPLTLEATVNKAAPYPIGDRAEVMGVSARGSLKRSEFGMTYGVADGLVGDEVEIVIEIEARRQPGNARPMSATPDTDLTPEGGYATDVAVARSRRTSAGPAPIPGRLDMSQLRRPQRRELLLDVRPESGAARTRRSAISCTSSPTRCCTSTARSSARCGCC